MSKLLHVLTTANLYLPTPVVSIDLSVTSILPGLSSI